MTPVPSTVRTTLLTAGEFEALADALDSRELWDGRLVVGEPASFYGGVVGARVAAALDAFARPGRLGWVADASAGYWVAHDPDRVLSPDVSFVRRERMPSAPSRGFARLVPDLVVEIRSPRDAWETTVARGGLWIAHGAAVVWLLDPTRRRALTLRPPLVPEAVVPGGFLDAAPVLPGLRVPWDDVTDGVEVDPSP